MPAKTVACKDCRKGTDRPSGICYHCAAVRQNKERAKEDAKHKRQAEAQADKA